jgi:thiamine biosynthesis lipoprotein
MRASSSSVRRARPLLGTLVEIRATGRSAERAVERAFGAIERVHRAMSRQEGSSDIARIRAGRFHALDPWTQDVLERAAELRAASDGLFNPAACGHSLDGIAKGFAVDRAVRVLEEHDIEQGAVNAGGDLRLFGDIAEDVYVRPPGAPGTLVCIGTLRNVAVATSASLALIDPRRRTVRRKSRGVTVGAVDCMTADALTKPCLLEPGRAHALAARFGAQVLMLQS